MGDIMGHKDRQIWSPSHVLQDPLFHHSTKQQQNSVNNHHPHYGSGFFHLPGELPLRESTPLYYTTRQNQQSNWQRSNGEDRMQPFFLVPPGRTTSGGTGVFLPAIASHPPTKPACSPVLLPTRVVQALNLNVHNNGIHMSPRLEIRENDSKKKSEMLVTPMKTEVEAPIDSPEKLLPEEWIY